MNLSPEAVGLAKFGQFPPRKGTRGSNWTLDYILERFWSKVSVAENGCWIWNGPHDKNGYGWIGGKTRLALFIGANYSHRISWALRMALYLQGWEYYIIVIIPPVFVRIIYFPVIRQLIIWIWIVKVGELTHLYT